MALSPSHPPTTQLGCRPARHLLESLSFQARGYPEARLGLRGGPILNSTLSAPVADLGSSPRGKGICPFSKQAHDLYAKSQRGTKVRQPAWPGPGAGAGAGPCPPTPSTPALNPLLVTNGPLPFPFQPGQGGGEGVTRIQLWVRIPGWASNISAQSVTVLICKMR